MSLLNIAWKPKAAFWKDAFEIRVGKVSAVASWKALMSRRCQEGAQLSSLEHGRDNWAESMIFSSNDFSPSPATPSKAHKFVLKQKVRPFTKPSLWGQVAHSGHAYLGLLVNGSSLWPWSPASLTYTERMGVLAGLWWSFCLCHQICQGCWTTWLKSDCLKLLIFFLHSLHLPKAIMIWQNFVFFLICLLSSAVIMFLTWPQYSSFN